jgi:hypothetical protein
MYPMPNWPRRLLACAAALMTILAASLLAAPTPAAQAVTCIPGTSLCQGGVLKHVTDNGYDAPIIVYCNFGSTVKRLVREGESSQKYCGDDTDQIELRYNEELVCRSYVSGTGYQWVKVFDATGRHKIGDFWERECALTTD